jgi:hypothetical protein
VIAHGETLFGEVWWQPYVMKAIKGHLPEGLLGGVEVFFGE